MTELCPCGKPLHYTVPSIERMVRELVRMCGETVDVICDNVTYQVPRHYIALHGIKAQELPKLAKRFKWKTVT